jgi:hypothetical protein
VEKRGSIKVFPNQDDVQGSIVFLDIAAKVNATNSESGMLSIAFHPQFPDSNKFYVYYIKSNPYPSSGYQKIPIQPTKIPSALSWNWHNPIQITLAVKLLSDRTAICILDSETVAVGGTR